MRRAPAAVAFFTCTVASYLAPMGQMGTHDDDPQHAGRPSRWTELRACGVGPTISPTRSAPRATMPSRYDCGSAGMG